MWLVPSQASQNISEKPDQEQKQFHIESKLKKPLPATRPLRLRVFAFLNANCRDPSTNQASTEDVGTFYSSKRQQEEPTNTYQSGKSQFSGCQQNTQTR